MFSKLVSALFAVAFSFSLVLQLPTLQLVEWKGWIVDVEKANFTPNDLLTKTELFDLGFSFFFFNFF